MSNLSSKIRMIGEAVVNWTDLQQKYADLTDCEMFVKYATDNSKEVFNAEEAESYFAKEEVLRAACLDDIMEYDFFGIGGIESVFVAFLRSSTLSNIDILLRLTAVSMLKHMPAEVSVKERARGDEVSMVMDQPPMQGITAAKSKSNNTSLPEFYYPM